MILRIMQQYFLLISLLKSNRHMVPLSMQGKESILTPDPNYNGNDIIVVTVNDVNLQKDFNVTFQINPVADNPTAGDDDFVIEVNKGDQSHWMCFTMILIFPMQIIQS